jgi:hypothetical protein
MEHSTGQVEIYAGQERRVRLIGFVVLHRMVLGIVQVSLDWTD